MKRALIFCSLVLALAAALGFLVAAPSVDADEICNCYDLNYHLSSSATGTSCDDARANLEAELRLLAGQECRSRHGDSSDDCNFAVDPVVSCYAIDYSGTWGASGGATYDCLVCRDRPSPPPIP